MEGLLKLRGEAHTSNPSLSGKEHTREPHPVS